MAHVLLIEPDATLANSYAQALQHVGYTVRHATSAQTALDTADSLAPDVVVLELQLPSHSGIEFLQEFRSYREWQAVPIVVNTFFTPAAIGGAAASLARDFGVRTCLYKPHTTLKQLIRAVNEQLVGR